MNRNPGKKGGQPAPSRDPARPSGSASGDGEDASASASSPIPRADSRPPSRRITPLLPLPAKPSRSRLRIEPSPSSSFGSSSSGSSSEEDLYSSSRPSSPLPQRWEPRQQHPLSSRPPTAAPRPHPPTSAFAPPPRSSSSPPPPSGQSPLPPRPKTPPPPADYEEYVAYRQRQAGEAAARAKSLKSKRSMPSFDFLRRMKSRNQPTAEPEITSPLLQEASARAIVDLERGLPPLPTLPPHFNSPFPATRQRYVPAGGEAPLSSRSEIPGPAFSEGAASPAADATSGASMSKEQLEAKLRQIAEQKAENEKWQRENFPDYFRHESPAQYGVGATAELYGDDPVDAHDEDDKKRRRGSRGPSTTGSSGNRLGKLKKVFGKKE